jgi:hypothetical protein
VAFANWLECFLDFIEDAEEMSGIYQLNGWFGLGMVVQTHPPIKDKVT